MVREIEKALEDFQWHYGGMPNSIIIYSARKIGLVDKCAREIKIYIDGKYRRTEALEG